MAAQSPCYDTADKLNSLARQAGCLAEYLRRRDLENAHWLLQEITEELAALDNHT